MERTTDRHITKLEDHQIFVFGSNLSGIHGAGAAKTALSFGAELGKGTGIQGNTYAIPTKDATVYNTLSIDEIKNYVDDFISFAISHSEYTFLVTEIGCGLAGLTHRQIAPLFKDAIEVSNIHLPEPFWNILTCMHIDIKTLPTGGLFYPDFTEIIIK